MKNSILFWDGIFFVQFDEKIFLDKCVQVWYNDRPTLGALAGIRVMSSDINFFIQNAQNVCSG